MSTLKIVLLTVYIFGGLCTFLAEGALVLLGGNAADLWRPFFFAAIWPIHWLMFVVELFR